MCCSPAARALKAQRKTERYNRKTERYNRRHGVCNDSTNSVPSTSIVLVQSSAAEARENMQNRDTTSPPSYHAVMGNEPSAADWDGTGMIAEAGCGDFVALAGTQGYCGGRCGGRRVVNGHDCDCGGKKRGGLVAMLFRLGREGYAAYKENKAVGEADLGRGIARSEKY